MIYPQHWSLDRTLMSYFVAIIPEHPVHAVKFIEDLDVANSCEPDDKIIKLMNTDKESLPGASSVGREGDR